MPLCNFNHEFRGLGRCLRKQHRCAPRLGVLLKNLDPDIEPIQDPVTPLNRCLAGRLIVNFLHHGSASRDKLFSKFFKVLLKSCVGEFLACTRLKMH